MRVDSCIRSGLEIILPTVDYYILIISFTVHASVGNRFCTIILFRNFDILKFVLCSSCEYILPINDIGFHCCVKIEFSPA